jgi:hypothetical protein
MSEWDPQSQLLHELANRAPDDPLRQAFESQLHLSSSIEREHWQALLKETDQFHSELSRVPIPAGLEQKLLGVPDEKAARRPWWDIQLDWRAAAAILLITVMIGGYLLLPSHPRPKLTPVLAESVAVRITDEAVQYHQSQMPLEVASNDAKEVETALGSHNLGFPVMVLQPRADLDLRGGGVCDFGGTPAAFTRWQGNGLTYTVYQFDGKKLGAPPKFLTKLESPKELWVGDNHYRVVIWPGSGGACTWALVMENEKAIDAFSQAVY